MIRLPTEQDVMLRSFALHRVHSGETQTFVFDCTHILLQNVELYVTIENKLDYTFSISESFLIHLAEEEIDKLVDTGKPVLNEKIVIPYEHLVSHPFNEEKCITTITAMEKRV